MDQSTLCSTAGRGGRRLFPFSHAIPYHSRMNNPLKIGLVGAGPLGIEIAVALKKAGLSYVHVEAAQIGATMQWWAPGTRWFSSNERISIAGVPLMTASQEKSSREEYLAYLRSIVEQFDLDIHTYTRIIGIERTAEGFTLHARKSVGGQNIGSGHTFHVDKLILSTGGTERPNLLHVPGEDLPHVSHYFHDPHTYFRRELLIVGGRNSAVEAALRCYRAGAKVSVAYRGAAIDAKDIKYWLYPEFSSLVKADKIPAYFNAVVREITPTHVILQQADGQTLPVAADFVLLLTGYLADMALATMAGVETAGDQQVPTYNPHTMETNVPGLYIAGTAIAGTQKRYRVFLENCHVHVERILAHLTGVPLKEHAKVYERPET
jgi:thioredoxin reductase (NADPH)